MTTVKLGVIGHPISHSKSPLIHNYWIAQHRLDARYEAIDIAPEELGERLRGLADLGYAGFNLTVPHKELALALCDEVDLLARAVGAVNTIRVEDGILYGLNTDVFGFTENIRQNAPGFDFTAAPAVVLGAGGAARACVFGLLQEGAPEIRVLNRTREKAEALAALGPAVRVMDWDSREEALTGAGLLVNATTLGMAGKAALMLDLAELPDEAVVNDIVYTPLYTPLLIQAELRGNRIVTGLGMLLHQARPAFEARFGILPEVDTALLQKVLA